MSRPRWPVRGSATAVACLLALLGLLALSATPAAAADVAGLHEPCDSVPGDDWCEEWATMPVTELAVRQIFTKTALSPDGTRLYVAANDPMASDDSEWIEEVITSAFDASTGRHIWTARYPIGRTDDAIGGIAVSPDGTKVFVVAQQVILPQQEGEHSIHDMEFVTVAYNAAPPQDPVDPALGQQLWATTGPRSARIPPGGVEVTPDGSTVVIAGTGSTSEETPRSHHWDLVTIAYDAVTGQQRWLSRYGTTPGLNGAQALALSPDGAYAYVTGTVGPPWDGGLPSPAGHYYGYLPGQGGKAVTLAYPVAGPSAGILGWDMTYVAPPRDAFSRQHTAGWDVEVSNDGSRVFVAVGLQETSPVGPPYSGRSATVAYVAASGQELWDSVSDGRSNPVYSEWGSSLALSPDDGVVYSLRSAVGAACESGSGLLETGCEISVQAYDQAGGDLRWAQSYAHDGLKSQASSIAASPDGSRVFVAGEISLRADYVAGEHRFREVFLAFDSLTGTRVATAVGRKRPNQADHFPGAWVLPSPDGGVHAVWNVQIDAADRALGHKLVLASFPAGPIPETDVSLDVAVSRETVRVGEPLTYSFEVRNAGPAQAFGPTLRMPLPAGVQLASVDPSQGECNADDGHVTCALGRLPEQAVATVRVTVVPQGTGTIFTTAELASKNPDPDRDDRAVGEATPVSGDGPPLPAGDLAVGITSPASHAQIPVGPSATLPLRGAARFETPAPSETKFHVGGDAAEWNGPDPLTTDPASSPMPGGWEKEEITPLNELSPDKVEHQFTTRAGDGVPLTVDASKPLSGVVATWSVVYAPVAVGAGLTTIDITVTGVEVGATEAQTLGTASVSYTATPQSARYNTPWTAAVAETADRKDFASLTLHLVVRGYNAAHGVVGTRDTTVTVPTYTAGFTPKVEIAVDDGPFSSDAVTLADDFTSWTATVPVAGVGARKIRVRAIQGGRTTPPRTRTVTITPPLAAPANVTQPVVDGAPAVGSLLHCSPGQWSGTPTPTFSYQWMRDGVALAGAGGDTYPLVDADAAMAIACRVTATNSQGTAQATSPAVNVAAIPPLDGLAVMAGAADVGAGLSCLATGFGGAPPPTFKFEWLRDGQPIAGATADTYAVTDQDAGHALTCRITATNPGGTADAVSSDLIIPSPPGAPAQPTTQDGADAGSESADGLTRGSDPGPFGRAVPLQIKVRPSVRRNVRGGKLRTLKLQLISSEPLSRLTATLIRGKRKYGRGRLAQLVRARTLTVRLSRPLRRGAYRLRLAARRADGSTARVTVRVVLR